MNPLLAIKALLRRNGVHPRRWLTGFVSYPQCLSAEIHLACPCTGVPARPHRSNWSDRKPWR